MDPRVIHEFMSELVPLSVIIVGTLSVAWVCGAIVSAFKQRARLRAQTEFHNRMLDKFSGSEDFAAYLKSDAGRSFFDSFGTEPASPLSKILSSIQRGAIFTLLGVGLIVLGNIFSPPEGGGLMLVCGVVSFMVGAGFLVSSYISQRLAKNWGLMPAATDDKSLAATAPATTTSGA